MPEACLDLVRVSLFETCPTVIPRYSLPVFPGVAPSQVGIPAEPRNLRSCRAVCFCESVVSVGCMHVCVALCVCVCVSVSGVCLKECCQRTSVLLFFLSLPTFYWPVCVTLHELWGTVFFMFLWIMNPHWIGRWAEACQPQNPLPLQKKPLFYKKEEHTTPKNRHI